MVLGHQLCLYLAIVIFTSHLKFERVGMVTHTFSLNTWGAEVGRSVRVQGQPGLYSKFQDNQRYIVRSHLRKIK